MLYVPAWLDVSTPETSGASRLRRRRQWVGSWLPRKWLDPEGALPKVGLFLRGMWCFVSNIPRRSSRSRNPKTVELPAGFCAIPARFCQKLHRNRQIVGPQCRCILPEPPPEAMSQVNGLASPYNFQSPATGGSPALTRLVAASRTTSGKIDGGTVPHH